MVVVNVQPDRLPALKVAARAAGMTVDAAQPDAVPGHGRMVLWEADAGNPSTDLSQTRVTRLAEFVRTGGNLLLTIGPKPGTGPFRAADILPTTAWRTLISTASRGGSWPETDAVVWDKDWFPDPTGLHLSVPYRFPLRPFDAVERGMGRYERYDRPVPYVDLHRRPWEPYFTRPLIDRDWRVRIGAPDDTGLLLTGCYGAGRVAVFGSSAVSIPEAVWTPLLRWLAAPSVAPAPHPAALRPDTAVDKAARTLRVTLTNPTKAPLPLVVVARLLTWENALIGDLTRESTLAAGETKTVDIPLPAPASTNYQALDARDAFVVRLGILSANGADLLSETRLSVDFRPDDRLSLSLDNLRARPYPFDAPGYDVHAHALSYRMGSPVMAYAYPPGHVVTARVDVAHGVSDLAPFAVVRDETLTTNCNASVMALNDGCVHAAKGPRPHRGGYEAWSAWYGATGVENVLTFTFTQEVVVAGVVLNGSPADDGHFFCQHNPAAAVVEVDGRELLREPSLDIRFVAEHGLVRLPFAELVRAREVRLRLPWTAVLPDGRPRLSPGLGEVEVEGAAGPLPAGPLAGKVRFVLHDALAGTETTVGERAVSVAPGRIASAMLAFTPPGASPDARFYRLEAQWVQPAAGGIPAAEVPLLTLAPRAPLRPLTELEPTNAPMLGFIVTRGFRNAFDLGTGTQETPGAWDEPDDLVWAYSRQLKQTSPNNRTFASRLYVSEHGLSPYANPWTLFPNGEAFFDVAMPRFVERMRADPKWNRSDVAVFDFSDRWDTGPSMNRMFTWPEIVAFDESLRTRGLGPLHGRTRKETIADIHAHFEVLWRQWQMARYGRTIGQLRAAFAQAGKRLVISAQGVPLVPNAALGELAQTIQGMNNDETWGMTQESPVMSAGRQMAVLALNPEWRFSTILVWGYDSAILCNPEWWSAVGTTETSRRHYYDRAWRGRITADGQYRSIHTFGYSMNAGVSWCMNDNDWQESWRLQERHSLLSPDGPIGAGLVVSTARLDDQSRLIFSGGGTGDSDADKLIEGIAGAIRALHEAGVSLPFATSMTGVERGARGAPLILLDPGSFSSNEFALVRQAAARGQPIAAFSSGQYGVPSDVAAFFGVTTNGEPATGTAALSVGRHPSVTEHDGRLFVPVAPDRLGAGEWSALFPALHRTLRLPIRFPPGTAGYGFTSAGRRWIVVEDWREEGRIATVRLRAQAGARTARAVGINEHRALAVRRDGDDWAIDVPLRPGDGELVAVQEDLP